MENRLVEVVYVATGNYCKYAETFFKSIYRFMPGVKKIVTVLSNGLSEYEGFCEDDVVYTRVIKMFDLIYPCINLHKPYFIEQLPKTGADYIFYFDADTIFKDVPNYDWEGMFKELDEGKVLVSKHPMYAAKESATLLNTKRDDWIANFFTENMTEKDPQFASYIDADVYTYVISSFYAARRDVMHELDEYMIVMTRSDLTRNRLSGYHIPRYMDENYFNAMVYDYENGKLGKPFGFSVKQYSEIPFIENEECDSVFIYQKNISPDFKTNRQ